MLHRHNVFYCLGENEVSPGPVTIIQIMSDHFAHWFNKDHFTNSLLYNSKNSLLACGMWKVILPFSGIALRLHPVENTKGIYHSYGITPITTCACCTISQQCERICALEEPTDFQSIIDFTMF